ncbi:hypothetical protein [Piscirickettsia salmonis]|uniref:hypothetical protein n=1 Tax=Piscirickettsia salmonis TaxID=1238 RepID=UPI0007C8B0E3|nr:hypothetical protein A0O36_01511 [Piscirickettsiaceae bacterium NZ-RLO1]
MPLELDHIVDVNEHGVRYKQSAQALHFQLAGKEFDIHPLNMPLYFGDVRSADQFNFLARTVSQLGVYFRHGLKNLPDHEDQENRSRRERKLKATHETQLALMALAPLLKLNRYSQCTRQEFLDVIEQVDRKIDEIFAAEDDDVINNALKTIIKNRLGRMATAAEAQDGANIDVTALHLYSDVVDLSEALLEGLQEKSVLEYDRRDTLTVRSDNLYKNVQKAKTYGRDPQNQRRGHGQALNDSNFGLFAPADNKTAHEEQQQEAGIQEEEYYFDPTHYGMDEASIVEYCDYLEAIEAKAVDPKEQVATLPAEAISYAAEVVDPEEGPTATVAAEASLVGDEKTSPTDLTQTEANRNQQETLAEQLKDERSKHKPVKAIATRSSWYRHRAGSNNLLVAGPAAFAIAGAVAGSFFPVIGTAIGAAIGAGVGYFAAATHHAIAVEEKKNGGYFVEPAKRLGAGLLAPLTYVVNAIEVAARPVIRWRQKALLGWGSTKHPKLELISSAASKLTLPDPQAAVENKRELAKDGVAKAAAQGSAKAKKPAVPVTAPAQLTLDTGGGFSSIPAATTLFTGHITRPLASFFASNPTGGLLLHASFWGPLGAITLLKAAGASHLSHIETALVKAYDYVSNMFSGSTSFVGSMWAWIVPGKFLELIILDPLLNPLKQTELFGHFFKKLETIKNDPHRRRDVLIAKQLMQTVLMLALTGAAANLAAPLIARAFKTLGMEVDFGSNPIGQAWNDVLVMTKGSALATSMMLFNNQPEHIMRDTTAVLANIMENHGEAGRKHVQNICDNLKKLQQLSPEAYDHLTPLQQADVRARFHDLKKVFGVELMYALVPGEKFGIRPPAPTNLLGKAVNWVVSVPIGICRGLRHPIAVGAPAVANFAAGILEFAAVIKQFASGLVSKVARGNIFTRQVAKRLPGFGGNEQEVADNLQAKYDNQRPEINWLLRPLKSWSHLQHRAQRSLTNLMHRCTAYAMAAGKNTLPRSPGLVEEELRGHGIEVSDGHPVFQGDGFGREPEPGREASPGPELAREPEEHSGPSRPSSPTASIATASTTVSSPLTGDASSTTTDLSPRELASPATNEERVPISQSAPVTSPSAIRRAVVERLWDSTRQAHPVSDQAASGPASYSTSTPLQQAAVEADAQSQSLPERGSQSLAAMGQ